MVAETKNKKWRWRPKKDFSEIKKKVNKPVKKWRWRPKKDTSKKYSVNTKIQNHWKEVRKISKNNSQINTNIKNVNFVSKKIEKKENKKNDSFALWLLVFSMLFFIFSLYKTFYWWSNYINENNIWDWSIDLSIEEIVDTWNTLEKIEYEWEIDYEIIIETGTTIIKDVSKDNIENRDFGDINILEKSIIESFYQKINNKEFDQIYSIVDWYLRKSNTFVTYYNENRLSDFLSKITNERIYISEIQETKIGEKENVKYFNYFLKYKLKDKNELFKEKREIAIVDRWGQKLIWSLICVTDGCSKMPFFNPQLYWIR